MTVLFCSESDPPEPWRQLFARAFPAMGFRIWPDLGPAEDVRYALVWRQPRGLLAKLPNLKAILVLGAGVDAVLEDPTLPPGIPVLRLVDAGLPQPMAEYALYAVLHFQRTMRGYLEQQRSGTWRRIPWSLAPDWPVGVMGLGVIGSVVARYLSGAGYPVAAWVREPRTVEGLEVYAGAAQLPAFLARSRVVVNVLALTPQTRDILDARAFGAMPRGSFIVNIGRGEHVVEDDLLRALDAGQLAGAALDVFRQEPLPADHPFWRHPGILVTPHTAAPTIIEAAGAQVVENVRRIERGEAPLGLVDRRRGY
ncbi:MAG TPA: glyoxylate/hydroxypyruvate reductase A [Burkholderiales bacterium]|jgi:glyoxylate/hydroxypyruvate reductase A|nr:glyoxylate/hydroxypyruvate reductase A [Burkholderiales bacterium]